jgi:predicted peptidase
MGASMGGYGSWQMAMSLPEYFAAMVPICGGGLFWNAARLVNVPVWAFHGGKDTVIPPEESMKMVDAVNAAGGNAKLTIYPDNDHNAWTDTYSNPEVFAWLLAHKNINTVSLSNPYRNVQQYG